MRNIVIYRSSICVTKELGELQINECKVREIIDFVDEHGEVESLYGLQPSVVRYF